MNKILIGLLLLSLSCGTIGCKSNKDQVSTKAPKEEKKAGEHREALLDEFIAKLNLIGAQEDQFRAVQNKYEIKMEKARKERNIDALRALSDQQLAEIKSILSETQFATFEEEMFKQRQNPGVPPPPKS